jgi:hypothetical protein
MAPHRFRSSRYLQSRPWAAHSAAHWTARCYAWSDESPLATNIRLMLGICLSALLLVVLLRLVLPILLGIAALALMYRLWRSRFRAAQQQRANLNAIFYDLLKVQEGRIRVLDLAMQAQLSGKEAKAYLEEQSQHFGAHFDVSEDGDIVYVFLMGITQ